MPRWCLNFWQAFLLLFWALWWGGLSFYAIVVVPIGTELIGSTEQGFITQSVTRWHNILTGGFVVCLFIEAIRMRSRMLWSFVIALAIIEIGLIRWHWHLTEMMDFADHSVPSSFYSLHAIYLWITAAEWFIGIALIAALRVCAASHEIKVVELSNSPQGSESEKQLA
jgi:hypothetical protein